MEELTRTQTVLLCVLVSFVTSIGTGIITVSLLQEAPPGVTQTINQVVERTVERVVPGPSSGGQTVKETTVVVKEEDLVIDAIKKNEKSLVRIAQNPVRGVSNTNLNTISLGLVVSANGNILADRRALPSGNTSFVATFHDGRQFPIKIISSSGSGSGATSIATSNFVYLGVDEDSVDSAYVFSPAITANSDSLQLGQTIIALGGKTQTQVAIGRISLLNFSDATTSASTPPAEKTVSLIQTESSLKDEVSGALLLNLNGELVGVESWHPEAPSLPDQFFPINLIKISGAKFFALTQ